MNTAETGFLCIVADKAETFGFVLNDIGSDGWMVGDLFNEEGGRALIPVTVKQSNGGK